MMSSSVIHWMMRRTTSQVRDLPHPLGHSERRWFRITFVAESPVATTTNMVFADVVFTRKRALKIARAFVKGSSGRAAADAVVQTGFHFTLTFNHGTKRNMISARILTKVTHFYY
ncbi:hypothetical protein [Acidicapsa ligni]|uniref:hypothetical protein n=1 Tax=Acidicapsa ligni TaxID=542300 RepID=UPI0021DF61EC|nr:hypothetical protein [Acidicapsa ligni]